MARIPVHADQGRRDGPRLPRRLRAGARRRPPLGRVQGHRRAGRQHSASSPGESGADGRSVVLEIVSTDASRELGLRPRRDRLGRRPADGRARSADAALPLLTAPGSATSRSRATSSAIRASSRERARIDRRERPRAERRRGRRRPRPARVPLEWGRPCADQGGGRRVGRARRRRRQHRPGRPDPRPSPRPAAGASRSGARSSIASSCRAARCGTRSTGRLRKPIARRCRGAPPEPLDSSPERPSSHDNGRNRWSLTKPVVIRRGRRHPASWRATSSAGTTSSTGKITFGTSYAPAGASRRDRHRPPGLARDLLLHPRSCPHPHRRPRPLRTARRRCHRHPARACRTR